MTGMQQAGASGGSMDEILASIRKIIAEDGAMKPQPAAPVPTAAVEPNKGRDVLELTKVVRDDGSIVDLNAIRAAQRAQQAPPAQPALAQPLQSQRMVAQATPPASAPTMGAPVFQGQPVFRKPETATTAPQQPAPPVAQQPAPRTQALSQPPAAPAGGLASSTTARDVSEAFQTLKASVREAVEEKAAQQAPQPMVGGRTVESLAEELMRPMLKAWIDANLAPLVEKIVRQEIERIRTAEEEGANR